MIRERKGYKYSLNPFEGYTHRHVVVAECDKWGELRIVDVYTDDGKDQGTENLLSESAKSVFNLNLTATVIYTDVN